MISPQATTTRIHSEIICIGRDLDAFCVVKAAGKTILMRIEAEKPFEGFNVKLKIQHMSGDIIDVSVISVSRNARHISAQTMPADAVTAIVDIELVDVVDAIIRTFVNGLPMSSLPLNKSAADL